MNITNTTYILLFIGFFTLFYINIIYPEKFKKIIDNKSKELNINETYKRKISRELSIFTIFPTLKKTDIEEYVWDSYILNILSDLIITNDDHFLINNKSFNDYKNLNRRKIEKFQCLILDKHFIYHGFLVENSIYLIDCLKEPLDNLKKLLKSSESGLCKETITKDILSEMYKVIDSFLSMVEELEQTALRFKTEQTKKEIFNYNSLNNMKEYSNLLEMFKNDMKEHKAIF